MSMDIVARALARVGEAGKATLTPDMATSFYVNDRKSDGELLGVLGQRIVKSTNSTNWFDVATFTNAQGSVLRAIYLTGWTSFSYAALTLASGTYRMWLLSADGLTKTEVTFATITGRTGQAFWNALHDGFFCAPDGSLWLAEYGDGDPSPDPVVWKVAVNTTAAVVKLTGTNTRHMHFVKRSLTTGHFYVGAGDAPAESQMYLSTDGGETWSSSGVDSASSWRAYSVEFLTVEGVNYVFYCEDQQPTAFHPTPSRFHRFVEGNFASRTTSPLISKGIGWSHIKLGDDIFVFSAPEVGVDAQDFGIYVYHTRNGVDIKEVGALFSDIAKAGTGDPPRIRAALKDGDSAVWVYASNMPINLLDPNRSSSAYLRLRKIGVGRHGPTLPLPMTQVRQSYSLPPTQITVDVDGSGEFGVGGLDIRSRAGQTRAGRSLFDLRPAAGLTGFVFRALSNLGAVVFSVTGSGVPSFRNSPHAVELPLNPANVLHGTMAFESAQSKAYVRGNSDNFSRHYISMYRGEVTADPANLKDNEWWVRTDLQEMRWRIGGVTYRVAMTAVA